MSKDDDQRDSDAFHEESYCERYPDIAQAVERGHLASGRVHFDLYGRAEGRIGRQILIPERVDLDPLSRIMTFQSAALVATPPIVINSDKIPTDMRAMYASRWQNQPEAREIACHVLQDVIVVGDGLVFDSSERLVAASAHQTSARQIEQAAIRVREHLRAGCETLSGTTLICEKIGVINYGHWLVEMAPIAYLLRDRIGADWFLRAPIVEGVPTMTAVIRDTLDLLDIDPARLRWATGSVPQRYERLILTSGFSYHGIAYSPLASAAFDAMASKVPVERSGRIWVSRAGLRRRMQDEDGLCDALASRGWTILSPGAMSLRKQIALFKEAEVVAGVSGAGLTNFGFSRGSTQVIAFVPAQMPDIFFWSLAQMKGQAYTEIRCRQEHSYVGLFNWDGMLMMESDEAIAHLDAILDN